MKTEMNHAEQNAKAWLSSIKEMVAKLNTENDDERDKAIQEIEESVLFVGVRGSTFRPVGEKVEPDEFVIELSTGGPALRIVGNLGQYNQPENPVMEYQDWGTPWTRYDMSDEDLDVTQKFVSVFYFGE